MNPQLFAILTVFIIGIVSFLIGRFLTSSSWRRKYDDLHVEKERLNNDNLNLNKSLKKVNDTNRKLEENKRSSDRIIDEKDETIRLLKDRLAIANTNSDPAKVQKLKESIEKEKAKSKELKNELSAMKASLENKTDKKTAITNQKTEYINPAIQSPISNPKITNIMQKIGISNSNQTDELTQIVGIGPEIAKKLNEIGIVNYNQLGKLDNNDLTDIDEALEFFPGRALRDNWIGQAKDLYYTKYGEKI